MPRIDTIDVRGLKAHDRTYRLGPCSLILGRPGSGKTAAIDAVVYSLLGYVPRLGRSESATAALMREDEIAVTATLDDGRTISRGLTRERTKKGTALKSFARASWADEGGSTTEHGAAITALAGANAIDAGENLDLSELLRCSAAERAKRIMALLDVSGMGAEEAAGKFGVLLRQRLARTNPADEHEIEAGEFGDVAAAVRKVAPEICDDVEALLLSGPIGSVLEGVRAKKLAIQAEGRAKVSARAAIEERLQEVNAPALPLAQIRKMHEDAVARWAAAEKALETAKAAADARAQAEAPIPALRSAADEARAELEAAIAALQRAEAVRREVEFITDPPAVVAPAYRQVDHAAGKAASEMEAEAAAIVDPPEIPAPAAAGPLDDDIASVTEALNIARNYELETFVLPDPIQTSGERLALDAAEARLKSAQASPWREVEEIASRVAAVYSDADQFLDDPERLRALAREHGDDVIVREAAVAKAREDLAAAQSRAEAREAEIKSVRASMQEARDLAKKARAEADRLRAEIDAKVAECNRKIAERHAAAVKARAVVVQQNEERRSVLRGKAKQRRAAAQAEADGVNAELRREYESAFADRAAKVDANAQRRKALADEAWKIETAARAAQAKNDRAQTAIREAEARLAGIVTVQGEDLAKIDAEVTAAREAIPLLKSGRERAERAATIHAEMGAIVAEIERLDAEQAAWSGAEQALAQVRQMDVDRRSSGLIARITEFLSAAGRPETAFIRATKAETAFGLVRDGREIAVEALSGAENVLFTVAMASAIVSLRQPELPVVLIEANELGIGDEAGQLFAGCSAISSTYGVQFIVASNLPLNPGNGWTVARLEEAVHVA